ncbi:MAG: NfeD family protein [Cyanobacteria bacterium P01_A01_bin.135]
MTVNPNVLFWLIVGCTLCFMELVIPTAFVEFTLGLSALIVALAAIVLPQLPLQICLFLLSSVALTLLARRITPRRARSIEDAAQGTALTPIPPHQPGRILYEGSSWQARCDHPDISIGLGEPVYIVSRQGNTLFVLPERSLYDELNQSHGEQPTVTPSAETDAISSAQSRSAE